MNETNGFPAWNNNPEIFEINRLPARSIFTGFADAKAALKSASGVPGPGPESGSDALPATVSGSDRFLSLNGAWRFSVSPNPASRPADFFRADFDSSSWGTIRVPAHWQLEGHDYPHYTNIRYPWENSEDIQPPFAPEKFNPVGSYVRSFTVPPAWDGMDVAISFQGVESAFYVWLNGEFVGYSEDSFTPAEFDLTARLVPGENVLAVEVYRWCDASWLEDQDFWRLSGIFRDVFLFARPPVHAYDYRARAGFDAESGEGTLDLALTLSAPPASAEGFQATLSLFDADGNSIGESVSAQPSIEAKAGAVEPGRVALAIRLARSVPSARPWSAEIPTLYTALVVLSDKTGATVESFAFRVGFRIFTLKDGLLRLNGKRIVFYGVNRHEFSMKTGRCVGKAEMVSDVLEMKRNNINAVRTSHYPNSLLWYDLCDYYGLYVIDETNIETHGTWQFGSTEREETALPGDRPEWTACVLDRARSMFFRDKNHASILMWSLGNESHGGTNHERMHDFFRDIDPDRVVHYEGVFHCRRSERASDVESQMYTPAAGLEAYAADYDAARARGEAKKPFILCEYSHAMGNSCGGLHLYTDLFKRHPCLQGGFIWDWIDQAIETTTPSGIRYLAYGGDFGDVPNDGNFSGNGLLFANRAPTPKLFETKACYRQFDFALAGGFSAARGAPSLVEITDRTLFSGFADLRLTWALLADGEPVASGKGEPLDPSAIVAKPPARAKKDGDEIEATKSQWRCLGLDEAFPAAMASLGGRELVLELALVRARDAAWAKAGAAVAIDQFVLPGDRKSALSGANAASAKARAEPATSGKAAPAILRAEDGSFSLTAGATGITLDFSSMGELKTIRNARNRLDFASFRPDFWRAPTDNDRGNAFAERLGAWKLASFWSHLVPRATSIAESGHGVALTVSYALPPNVGGSSVLIWELSAEGSVRLTQRLSPAKDRYVPEIPFIGVEAILSRAVEGFSWYGAGPHENHIDRRQGAFLGRYSSTPEASRTDYLKPQECGNRTGVRSLTLAGAAGELTFRDCRASERPVYGDNGWFEFSVLPWTRDELDRARHPYELVRSGKSALRVGMAQMGVGGDNSWGAFTLPEFTLPANRDYEWSVEIRLGSGK